MPLIGRIQVPEEFLKECAQNYAYSFLISEVIGINEINDLETDDPLKNDLKATGITYNQDLKKKDFIIALIRTQLDDWVRDSDDIMESMDFMAIEHEAFLLGTKIAFECIAPDSTLMSLAQKEFQPNKHAPLSP